MGRNEHFAAGAQQPWSYVPEHDAPAEGEWDRSGEAPRWRQQHAALVQDALWSMKGHHSTMQLHMDAVARGEGPHTMGSGSGKQMRTQAAALLHEINTSGKVNSRPLYRGDTREPQEHLQAWTSRQAVAKRFAGKQGQVHVAAPGTVHGVQVKDYIRSGLDESEAEWVARRR